MKKLSLKQYLLIGLGLIILAAILEYAQGRVLICKCGYVKLWHGVVFSSENSQHLTDWYTFSHIIHGFGFYLLFWWIGRRYKWPLGLRLVAAILLETIWEVFENSSIIINRYRAVTISLDYFGDSVINSMADILAMVVGFFMAYKFPVWLIIVLTILMEVFTGYYIHDNLTLNIIMLIHPFPQILKWQSGA